eukprot:TRINITY_DN3452_c0_g1_i3.p1 TRINITY_DN3452_c0_g1~~TRINITY_DN3452_c0_g1_i3.p1  ORF type:complete len:329 (-),score=56.97 TRINITY_DN3452_c0_g1_i3:22-1008(-)
MENVKKIYCGMYFSIVEKIDGSFFGMGSNFCGQLGIHVSDVVDIPKFMFRDVDVVSFCCGENHSIFFKSNGDIFVMGSNVYGQLGIGSSVNTVTKPTLFMNNKYVKSVSCGANHSFVLTSKKLYGFGKNSMGQLGLGNFDCQYEPKIVLKEWEIKLVHCGTEHSFLLKENGELYGAGFNKSSQLGVNTKPLLNQFTLLCDNVLSVSSGGYHSLIVNEINGKRKLTLSGSNIYGQLGIPSNIVSRNQDCDDLLLLQNNPTILMDWSAKFHFLYSFHSESFKQMVYTFMLCLKRIESHSKINNHFLFPFVLKLPKPLCYLVIKKININFI